MKNDNKKIGNCSECGEPIFQDSWYCEDGGCLYHAQCWRDIWEHPYQHPAEKEHI